MTGGSQNNREFSFVNMEYVNKATLEEALNDWNWISTNDSNNNIIDIGFVGESQGDYKVMFNAIAPFVENDSFIQMLVEDIYRRPIDIVQWWKFENGKLKSKKIRQPVDILLRKQAILLYEKRNI